MIRIYHGSLEEIAHPEVRVSNRGLDYGQGFYATSSYEQAKRWVERRMAERNVSSGYVNAYELDTQILKSLNVISFDKADEQWVRFVMRNRIEIGFNHNYDVVYGPVADDQVYAQFSLYEQGVISESTLLQELKTYKLVDQYLFHTNRAMQAIRFISSERVER